MVVAGGPEDLVDLLDLGLIGAAPVQLAADLPVSATAPSTPVVLTDGLRARERFFARIHDGDPAALTPGDRRRSGNPTRDYLIDHGDRWSTTVRLAGADAIAASSSRANSVQPRGAPCGGTCRTPRWTARHRRSGCSGSGRVDTAWWQVDLETPLGAEPGRMSLTGGPSAPGNQQLRLVTQTGSTDAFEVGPGQTAVVDLPPGPSAWLRLQDASGVPGRQVAVAEVTVPGLAVLRELATPELPDGWPAPDAVVLRADLDAATPGASRPGGGALRRGAPAYRRRGRGHESRRRPAGCRPIPAQPPRGAPK